MTAQIELYKWVKQLFLIALLDLQNRERVGGSLIFFIRKHFNYN